MPEFRQIAAGNVEIVLDSAAFPTREIFSAG